MGRSRRLRPGAVLAVLAAGAALTVSAAAAHEAERGLQISPSRIEEDIATRAFSSRVTVQNEGDLEETITVEVTGLGHDLEGRALFPDAPSVAASIRTDVDDLSLAPSERRTIVVDGEVPEDRASTYAAIVASLGAEEDEATGVALRPRLATVVLIRGPRPWDTSIEVDDIGVLEREGDVSARVHVDVANVGDVHVRPRGVVEVHRDGRHVTTVSLAEELILPGYARRLVGDWLLEGDHIGTVELVARFEHPPASASRTVDLGGLDLGGSSRGSVGGAPEPLVVGATALLIVSLLLIILVLRRSESGRRLGPPAGPEVP